MGAGVPCVKAQRRETWNAGRVTAGLSLSADADPRLRVGVTVKPAGGASIPHRRRRPLQLELASDSDLEA